MIAYTGKSSVIAGLKSGILQLHPPSKQKVKPARGCGNSEIVERPVCHRDIKYAVQAESEIEENTLVSLWEPRLIS